MSKLSRIFKSEKRQKEEDQEKLNKLAPEYQRRLTSLNNEFGVALIAIIDISNPSMHLAKIKVVLLPPVAPQPQTAPVPAPVPAPAPVPIPPK